MEWRLSFSKPRIDVQRWISLLAPLAAAWCVVAALELFLDLLIPDGALRHALLPPSTLLFLVSYQLAVLGASVLAIGMPLALLVGLGSRVAPGSRRTARGLVVTLLWAVLLLYGASWAVFWHAGQFLNGEALGLALRNSLLFPWTKPSYLLAWLVFLFGSTLVAALALTRWLPNSIYRTPPMDQRRFVLVAGTMLGLCGIAALGGQVMSRPIMGSDDRYAMSRDERLSPVASVLAELRYRLGSRPDPIPTDDDARLISRPLIPMDRYLSGVDRQRLRRWNVIVLLVESLRADQLRAYGGTKDVMPTLDALAREARVFTNAYTQASHSNYADLGPLSSHYPLRSRTIHYPPRDPTYPRVLIYDVLKALGYHTSVFSSQNEHWENVIHYIKTASVDRFFHGENFDGPTYVMLGDTGLANWVKQTKRAGSVDDRFTVREAIKWIESLDGEPFSMYLNLQNSHVPYPVPEDFPRRFSPATLDFTITFGHFPRAKAEVVKGVYADSLAYVDSQIGRLFEFLRTRGLWERTLIVVTGDHGQAFYEHGFASHASELYNEVMRVPLLIRAPGLGSGLDDRPAQHVDVPPSVFELLGLPPHPSFQGISLFDTERHEDRSLYMVCQTPLAHQYAVVRSGFKLLYDERRNSYKLYDLVRDPAETTDLARMRPALAKKLTDRLHAWRRAQIDYYEDESRHGREYPPILAD
jgi:arylsulfatase A-like enzyme